MPALHEPVLQTQYFCGPLRVRLSPCDAGLHAKIAETLSLYDHQWQPPYRDVAIAASAVAPSEPEWPRQLAGSFLRCGRMLVDASSDSLLAATTSGVRAQGRLGSHGEQWHIDVPPSVTHAGKLEELEDILSLVLTTGWRREGWTPVHAGAVVKDGVCAIVCAPTGGGKTTLCAALVRRGWQVVGDDKILLRLADGTPQIAALLHTFNLHPQTRAWFPEVGDLEVLPRYSAWTEKRKVSVTSIWSHAPVSVARPSVLLSLERRPDVAEIRMTPLDGGAVLSTLLRQTVIPADTATARDILGTIARTAAALHGYAVAVAVDAYRDPRCLQALEAQLEAGA